MDQEAINIGLSAKDRQSVVDVFNTMLATSHHLYLKVQHAHWNIVSKHFQSYHLLFESIYEELAEAIDEMAERIRALGGFPHGSLKTFLDQSLLKDYVGGKQSDTSFLAEMLNDHETLIIFLRSHLKGVESVSDGASADFINKRLMVSEKVSWQLRSHLT